MQEEKLITILTPAYNRAHLLTRLFESLTKQIVMNFEWIIVDDGSNDNTEQVVENFYNDKFQIRYYKKNNGGKHTAVNYGMNFVKTELTFIVDSDDCLLSYATKEIEYYYDKYKTQKDGICSFSFLRCYKNGKPIVSLDRDEFVGKYITTRIKENRPGDMAEVFFSRVLKEFPFPVFQTEKFLSEDVVWIPMGAKYLSVYINKAIYQCEYLEGGLTDNDKKAKFDSPIGSMCRGVALMTKECGMKSKIKGAIIYDCYKIAALKKYKKIDKEVMPKGNVLCFLLFPIGIVFYYRWRKKN